MSIREWAARKLDPKNYTLKDPEFPGLSDSMFAASGVSVTPDTAMKISAVYACVRILAETISSLPLRVYRRTTDGREPVDHPLNALFSVTSNGEQTGMEMREFQMSSLGLRGNAYGRILRSNRGGVGAIHPLKPAFMHLERDSRGSLRFDYQEPGNSGVFRPEQIWRVAGLGSDGVTGLSPVGLAKENMGLAITTEQSAARMFSSGNQTANTLEFDHTMTDEQIARLRQQFVDNFAGHKNAHKPLILESGMKAKNIGISATDAQFLESRKFQIAEIARWYRVPLHMLNELDKATFSNIEHQSIEFVVHTIRPWLVRIEQTISRDLLTEREIREGLFASHTVEGLLRGDTKARYEGYASAITNGWMSRNEVRRLENMNTEDGLDEFLTPLNMAAAGETVEDLAGAENRILQKEAAQRDTASFAAWLPGYYGRQERRIGRSLGVDAKGYGMARIKRMAAFEDPMAAAEEAQKFTADDIEALINE